MVIDKALTFMAIGCRLGETRMRSLYKIVRFLSRLFLYAIAILGVWLFAAVVFVYAWLPGSDSGHKTSEETMTVVFSFFSSIILRWLYAPLTTAASFAWGYEKSYLAFRKKYPGLKSIESGWASNPKLYQRPLHQRQEEAATGIPSAQALRRPPAANKV